ncbi:MAG TPA: ribosome biogenesis GTPase YlqF [Firmicutes bacterium]|nr:ribosome biogenesis GTPase YlqF [Bacillota bacterium]
MEIQWYPGQMAKAKRLLQENLRLVDAVIEVLDARIPDSSRNPDIRSLIAQRPVVAVLTHADLADPQRTQEWLVALRRDYAGAAAVNAATGEGIRQLLQLLKTIPVMRRHGGNVRRLMVVGIPNVGKSSLINRLTGRSAAKTGNKPGVTKGKQWVRLPGDLELLDTPGMLWPKIENAGQAFRLAAVGAVRDEIYDPVELGATLVSYLAAQDPETFNKRYRIALKENDPYKILAEIGSKRGCLQKGGEIDLAAAARLLVADFRAGRLGRLTLERVEKRGDNNDQFHQNDAQGD